MTRRPLTLLSAATALGSAAIAACRDPIRIGADLPTVVDTLVAFAVTGTPPELPSALNAFVPVVVRLSPEADFDLVFDIAEDGSVLLIPPRHATIPAYNGGRAGLVRVQLPFDSVGSAPRAGYVFDSVFVVPPERIGARRETVVLQTQSRVCVGRLSPVIFAKLAVDSVDARNRAVFFRIHTDPNCGFRSFAPGIPPSN